jgi:hypothetical protein
VIVCAIGSLVARRVFDCLLFVLAGYTLGGLAERVICKSGGWAFVGGHIGVVCAIIGLMSWRHAGGAMLGLILGPCLPMGTAFSMVALYRAGHTTSNLNGIVQMLEEFFHAILWVFHGYVMFAGAAAAATIAGALGGLFWGTLDAIVAMSGMGMLMGVVLIWAYFASPV